MWSFVEAHLEGVASGRMAMIKPCGMAEASADRASCDATSGQALVKLPKRGRTLGVLVPPSGGILPSKGVQFDLKQV